MICIIDDQKYTPSSTFTSTSRVMNALVQIPLIWMSFLNKYLETIYNSVVVSLIFDRSQYSIRATIFVLNLHKLIPLTLAWHWACQVNHTFMYIQLFTFIPLLWKPRSNFF